MSAQDPEYISGHRIRARKTSRLMFYTCCNRGEELFMEQKQKLTKQSN